MAVNQTFFHIAAYYGSVTNGVSDMAIAAVTDNILTKTTGNNFILPQPMRLRLNMALSADLQAIRINTPSLRTVGLPYLAPVNGSATIPSPLNLYNPGDYGPTIPVADEISIEGTQGNAGAQNVANLIWFTGPKKEVPSGQIYRLKYAATITGSAGVWASGSMTTNQTLPAGVYSIVGMDCQGTNLLAARLIFANGGWRPGCAGRNTLVQVPRPEFTNGDLGVYGEFDSVNTPNLEIFCIGACTAQTAYLDLIRIGNR